MVPNGSFSSVETKTNSYTGTFAGNLGNPGNWEFYVTAVNSAGESPPSNIITLNVPSASVKLEAPTGFRVSTTRVSETHYLVNVSWNPVSGATGYRIYSSSYLNGSWTPWELDQHIKCFGSSFGIAIDTPCKFYVTAINQAGEESPPSQEITVNIPSQTPPTPQAHPWGLSAFAGDNQVILTWQAQQPPFGKTLRGYWIYRSTAPGQAVTADRINDFPSLQPTWTDRTVQNGQEYYYVVRPVYNDGTTGPASEEVSAMPQTKRNVTIQLTIGSRTAYVNGQTKELIIPPKLLSDRAFLPLRFIGEAIGANLDWDPTEQRITYTLGSRNVTLWIGRTEAIVNGQSRTLDVAPVLTNGVTLVPVRFVTEALGFRVDWYENTQNIIIQQ
ncbi:MAG: copper amine oxidase N-terminal domain-containing protein [Bacillota bacterium]